MYMQTGCFHDTGRAAWRACRAVRLARFERMAALVVVLGIATALALLCRGLLMARSAAPLPQAPLTPPPRHLRVDPARPLVVGHDLPDSERRLPPVPTYQVVDGDIAPVGEAADVDEARAVAAAAATAQKGEQGGPSEVAPLDVGEPQTSHGGIRRVVDGDGGVTYTNL